ncbi:MAG: phage tail assembly protein [Synergistaceae bacterium]|nr:phage tail assembly protein [Synergistaceae bacterium]
MKIKLKKAILHKGEEIYTLDIPLEDLTGNDLIEAEEQIMKTGLAGQIMDISRVYMITIAARAAHMPVETLRQTSASDFNKIVNAVRDFLTSSDSEEAETEKSPTIPETLPEIS